MIQKTPLHNAHQTLNAKMGEFAGYDMPLYYALGVMKEHEWTRSHAGLFDVSHMGQIIIEGAGAAQFWEKLTPSAFQPKKPGKAQYSVLTNKEGGIIDDLIITRLNEERFFTVVNAGRKTIDIAWIKENLPEGLRFEYLEDRALIALQGPSAQRVMIEALNIDLSDLAYMNLTEAKAPCGADLFISRLGYTGEDGFEISIPADRASDIWEALVKHKEVEPVGLAARDSLRLEMGYPLYGHDIDESTSPVEADIAWIVSKKTEGYFGFERIKNERENGAYRTRVGVVLTGKGVAREGSELRNSADEKIGELTSGGFSPTLKKSIGQGYVQSQFAQEGTEIFVHVRGRNIAAEIQRMPFVAPKTKAIVKKQAA